MRPSSHAGGARHTSIADPSRSPFRALGLAMRAQKRKVLRPDRAPVGKARSPPARSACFPHPVQRKARGRSVAKQEAPLEIYNDQVWSRVQARTFSLENSADTLYSSSAFVIRYSYAYSELLTELHTGGSELTRYHECQQQPVCASAPTPPRSHCLFVD